MLYSGLWILIDFSGNMSAHQQVGAGKTCNVRLRSIITEGQKSNGRYIDALETEQDSTLEKYVLVVICRCETSCLHLDFA